MLPMSHQRVAPHEGYVPSLNKRGEHEFAAAGFLPGLHGRNGVLFRSERAVKMEPWT
jgi:hypothetical protein